MKAQVRKLSVGEGYPDGAIHYQVGKTVRLQGTPYEISAITKATEEEYLGKVAFHIFIKRDGEGNLYWKTICNLPVMIENNISFD